MKEKILFVFLLLPGLMSFAKADTFQQGLTTKVTGTVSVNPLPPGNSSIGKVVIDTVSLPVPVNLSVLPVSTGTAIVSISTVGVTTASIQLIAANSTRKGLEIDTDCSNTDYVAINFGISAVSGVSKVMQPCVSWQSPPGLVVTSYISAIAHSSTQTVRVIEYR